MQLDRPLVFFDLETTGVDPTTDRIVELGLLRVCPETPETGQTAVITASFLCNPGIPIPAEASAIHGFTDAAVAQCEPFAAHAAVIWPLVTRCDLAGYNCRSFDVPLLAAEFARCRPALAWPQPDAAIVDVFEIWKRASPRSLTEAARVILGQDHAGHRALADAAITRAILDGLLTPLPSLLDSEPLQTLRACASVAELALYGLGPDAPRWIDPEGKFIWSDTVPPVALVNFGRHKGKRFRDVPVDYFAWIAKNADFSERVRRIAGRAAVGMTPRPKGSG